MKSTIPFACYSAVAVSLVGCAGPMYEPWHVPKGETVFGHESCRQNAISGCAKGMGTTRMSGTVNFIDSSGFAYNWREDKVEKVRWFPKHLNGRDCFFLEGYAGPCEVVSQKGAARWGDVAEGDVFGLKRRYESGNAAMPSAYDISTSRPGFLTQRAHIQNELSKWDKTTALGGK